MAVIDADQAALRRARQFLQTADLDVIEATDGLDAFRLVFAKRPDAAVVDASVSGLRAGELVRLLTTACSIPVIATAVNPSPELIMQMLDAGAQDWLDKRSSSTEWTVRVCTAIQRHQRRRDELEDPGQVVSGMLVIDRSARKVTKHGTIVPLTRTEYRLLDALSSKIGETASSHFLLRSVWGEEHANKAHYLRLYISYLRAKLEDDPADPRYIITEWATGYRLARWPHGLLEPVTSPLPATQF